MSLYHKSPLVWRLLQGSLPNNSVAVLQGVRSQGWLKKQLLLNCFSSQKQLIILENKLKARQRRPGLIWRGKILFFKWPPEISWSWLTEISLPKAQLWVLRAVRVRFIRQVPLRDLLLIQLRRWNFKNFIPNFTRSPTYALQKTSCWTTQPFQEHRSASNIKNLQEFRQSQTLRSSWTNSKFKIQKIHCHQLEILIWKKETFRSRSSPLKIASALNLNQMRAFTAVTQAWLRRRIPCPS